MPGGEILKAKVRRKTTVFMESQVTEEVQELKTEKPGRGQIIKVLAFSLRKFGFILRQLVATEATISKRMI